MQRKAAFFCAIVNFSKNIINILPTHFYSNRTLYVMTV